MPVSVGAAIRGSSIPQYPASQSTAYAAPVNEYAVTLRRLCRSRTVLLLLAALALLAQIFAFAMVEWVRYFDHPDGESRSLVGEAAWGPESSWAAGLDAALAWGRLLLMFSTTALVLVLVIALLVTLVGRLSGTRAGTAALSAAVWFWVLALPWSRLPLDTEGQEYYSSASLGPMARFGGCDGGYPVRRGAATYPPGTLLARHWEMVEMRRDVADAKPDAPDTWERFRREANYFGRFVAYPAATMVLLLIIAIRSRRAYREAVTGV